jgi:hypothetical protein
LRLSVIASVRVRSIAPHPNRGSYARKFSGKYSHRTVKGGIGHNLPQEAPLAFAEAVVEVDNY